MGAVVAPARLTARVVMEAEATEENRYGIYAVALDDGPPAPRPRELARKRLAETSRDGIGMTLVELRKDGEITQHTRVGIRDQIERKWIVNPWARGEL